MRRLVHLDVLSGRHQEQLFCILQQQYEHLRRLRYVLLLQMRRRRAHADVRHQYVEFNGLHGMFDNIRVRVLVAAFGAL